MKSFFSIFCCLIVSIFLFGCDEKSNSNVESSNNVLGERFDALQICKDLYSNEKQASFKYSDGSVELSGKFDASYSNDILNRKDKKGNVFLSVSKIEKQANLDTIGDIKSIMKKINTINIKVYASIKADKTEAAPYMAMEGQTKILLVDKISSLKAEPRYSQNTHEVVLDCSISGEFIALK